MNDEKNTCVMCGKDCSFMSFVDGICLHCGDYMQANPDVVMEGFVKTCRRVADLERQLGAGSKN